MMTWAAKFWKRLWCGHHWHYDERNQVISRECCRCHKRKSVDTSGTLTPLPDNFYISPLHDRLVACPRRTS